MDTKQKTICGAKKRLSAEICRAAPMSNGRCRLHGGKSLKGFAHPRFKNGLYSRYMYLPELSKNAVEPKELVQIVATVYGIVSRHVSAETALKIQQEIERYYDRLYTAGIRPYD